MKYILFLFLSFLFAHAKSQDWSLTTTKLTKWTATRVEPGDSNHVIFHTTTIAKKGNQITFSYNGSTQTFNFSYMDKYPMTTNYRIGETPDFDDRNGPCYCYRTNGSGDIIYFYTKKIVMRFSPMIHKYVYFN